MRGVVEVQGEPAGAETGPISYVTGGPSGGPGPRDGVGEILDAGVGFV